MATNRIGTSIIARGTVTKTLTRMGLRQQKQQPATRALSSFLESSTSRSSTTPSWRYPSSSSSQIRFLSDNSKTAEQQQHQSQEEEKNVAEDESKEEEAATAAEADNEEKEEEEVELSREEQLEKEVKDLKDQLLRGLAEQDNTRRIAKRDVETARNFAITSFGKSLLETSDNLTRALEAVPDEYRNDKEQHPVLATLYEGIQMTDDGLTKAFAKNGLRKYGEIGETFDPNKHEALFEYSDPTKEAGSIGQVMKVGFMLKDRVLRPAEVGVIKKE